MKAAEQALRKYCASDLVKEYDESMSASTREKLLDGLLNAARQRLFMYLQRHHNGLSAITTNQKKSLKDDDEKCPLFRALVGFGVQRSAISHDSIEACRTFLQQGQWGSGVGYSPVQKILHYSSIVAQQRTSPQYKTKSGDGSKGLTTTSLSTNTVLVKTGGTVDADGTLRKIPYRELRLFEVSNGAYVEGKIVGEVIQPMVGGTTLIQDKDQDVLLVCFYNLLPDGLIGAAAEPLLKSMLPFGATLRIKEPFYKIFGDGQRGIRVDNPRDLEIVVPLKPDMSDDDREKLALEKKKLGNSLTGKGCYSSATDVYLTGLRVNELVPTLLSNRAQAYIKLQLWPQALCDAAASLTLRPKSDKTWARYDLCLEMLKAELDEAADRDTSARSISSLIVPVLVVDKETNKDVYVAKAQMLKTSGNEAFKKKDHLNAVKLYTEALVVSGETIRAILGNWAFCALKTGALGDVVAACVAALRIGNGEKALHRLATALSRLGEHELAKDILGSNQAKAFTGLRYLDNEIDRAKTCKNWFQKGRADDPLEFLRFIEDTPVVIGNWQGHVETYVTARKGRGLRATKAFREGAVVLVEWSPVSLRSDFSNPNDSVILNNNSDGKVEMNTSAKIKWHTIHRLQRDGVLEQLLNRLSGGAEDKSMELVPLTDLLVNLDMFPFLLPSHREYMRKTARGSELPKERIDSILETNTHGHSIMDGDGKSCSSQLYPAVSMMNHSSDPNCSFGKTSIHGLAIIVTTRYVAAGEELCMLYQIDSATLKSKWGVE